MDIFFDHIDKRYFLSLLDAYVRGFRERLMPILDEDLINKEADKAADQFYSNFPGNENTDPADVAEMALDHGVEVYQDLNFVRQQLIQLATAGLYHLWERVVKKTVAIKFRQIGDPPLSEKQINEANFDHLMKAMLDARLIQKNLTCRDKLDELRLVANTVKHGDGQACEKLFARRRDLFARDLGMSELINHFDQARAEWLDVREPDFVEYADSIRSFWDEVTRDQ